MCVCYPLFGVIIVICNIKSIIIVFIIMYIYYLTVYMLCICISCYGTNKLLLCDFCTFVQINSIQFNINNGKLKYLYQLTTGSNICILFIQLLGTFVWLDGSVTDYKNWAVNEPVNTYGRDCVFVDLGPEANHVFHTRDCNTPTEFICEQCTLYQIYTHY